MLTKEIINRVRERRPRFHNSTHRNTTALNEKHIYISNWQLYLIHDFFDFCQSVFHLSYHFLAKPFVTDISSLINIKLKLKIQII